MANITSKCTVTELCQAHYTVKTFQKIKKYLVAHDHNRTQQTTRHFSRAGSNNFSTAPAHVTVTL